jgi:tetratricopeptide (TPR) repeat protein
MKNRIGLIAGMVVCLAAAGGLQRGYLYNAWQKNYAPKTGESVAPGLDPSQLLATLAGFRELVAGILWVRADSFFDSGNYDAVLPIIRLVTWLDPKQIDVFATGMWHIGYNFTDEDSRSDRRYLPSAVALGKEGSRQNPDTYELFFETGWLWYHKIDDNYDQAVKWFELANQRKDMLPARRNLLGMAYQRNGQIEKAFDMYDSLYQEANKAYEETQEYQSRQIRDTLENNLDTMLVRMVQRGYFAQKRNDPSFRSQPYDVNPPFDVGFSVKATVEEPKVIRFEGTWNVRPVGTRIRVVLKDADFPGSQPGGANWDTSDSVQLDPNPQLTFMQDQLYVRNRRFNRKVDMSKDPTMYPFQKEKYIVEFYYNPRSAPPHIQDKFGWNGEGMTDSNFLNTEIRPGTRVFYTSFEFTRDELLRRREWRDKVPVRRTKNFKESNMQGSTADDVIQVPGLRSSGSATPGASQPAQP